MPDILSALLEARQLLADPTPLRADCGRLCRSACCSADRDGLGGMLLFPGEQRLYEPLPDGFAVALDRDGLGLLLTCRGRCDRAARPLACRMFPLFMYVRERDGRCTLRVAMDRRAGAVCPLVDEGMAALSRGFVDAVRAAARTLCRVPEHRQFLRRLTGFMDDHYALNGGEACSGSA